MLVLKKQDLTGRDVFEFKKGRYDGLHWNEDSIYVTEEMFAEAGLLQWFIRAFGFFHYYGPTEVTEREWKTFKSIVDECGSDLARQLVREIDEWAATCFKVHDRFTICGI